MTTQAQAPVQPKLTTLIQGDMQTDPHGTGFATLVGIDGFGNMWTTVGIVTNSGFFLNPWIQQPRPTILPKEPEPATATGLVADDEA